MTIPEARERCKALLERIPRDVLIVTTLIGASAGSFGFGYLSGREAGQGTVISLEPSPIVDTSRDGQVVASKNGTKYYLPWCAGAGRIAEQNKVWFASADAAREAGYALAANCK